MNDKNDPHPYVQLARKTISRLLHGEPLHGDPLLGGTGRDNELWKAERACFVSIKTLQGDLRGCIGTILPAQPSLDLEIISNAIAASTRDPRFPPMKAPELDKVTISVDVLSLPEPVSDLSELDPAVWGVIVSRGALRGVLLPDLEGVDTVEQQLDIAARKAGIRKIDDVVTIQRFRVDRYKE
ncbi:MAG: AmmeMemoRadiSam system protein A [Synergistaceae bacterium]|jgi:AmmeMemoRadiSam system protein A|nr:AmmeMemoRadiSam system protein A [Synergistaceae bacterium]